MVVRNMPTVQFLGNKGRILWNRVGSKLPNLQGWLLPNGLPKVDHYLDWIDFMLDAAWGKDPSLTGTIPNSRFTTRMERIKHRYKHNPRIYLLSTGSEETLIEVESINTHLTFSMGKVRGLTAVMPLTRDGTIGYFRREKAFGDLDGTDLIGHAEHKQTATFVLINTVLHFPSIVYLESFLGEIEPTESLDFAMIPVSSTPREYGGTGVILDLFRHIASFLPQIQVISDDPPQIQPSNDGAYPCIFSPISGNGMGEAELKAAGFWEEGTDLKSNTLFTFNLADLNKEKVPIARRTRMLKTIRLLNKLRNAKEHAR
jgi:hypothetical protein